MLFLNKTSLGVIFADLDNRSYGFSLICQVFPSENVLKRRLGVLIYFLLVRFFMHNLICDVSGDLFFLRNRVKSNLQHYIHELMASCLPES